MMKHFLCIMLAVLTFALQMKTLSAKSTALAEADTPQERTEAMEPEDEETFSVPIYIKYVDGEPEDPETQAEAVNAESPFVGAWQSENTMIYIDPDEDTFSVYILRESGEDWDDVWEYTCVPDDETGALTGEGKRSRIVYGEDGQPVSNEEIYNDGSAVFTLEDDVLIWTDAKEDIANGMRFERVEEVSE